MASSYTFMYFNGRGRGELSRMLFAAKGIEFEDKRIEFSDWQTVKTGMPQGTLPVLQVEKKDGPKKISQSMSIARYLAREFNLYGQGNFEMAITDQIADTLLDIFETVVKIKYNKNCTEEENAQQVKECNEKTIPKYLGFLENLMKETGKDDFAVGSSVTLGDLALYVYLENIRAQDKVGNFGLQFPLLAANRKKIAELPNVAKYLKNRKETPF